ncbi:type VII secretion protein EccB [Corynebacterium propinquum]|uniref:type VII secretion protein EccB n=1 Tax=Corynebacterium propinquum TaxID=43769 RepID=UPI002543CDFC|nr:type VII secretion protein EccB [Corynebacterium propinquum]MDK4292876.1 type VII secretion protein EccB [Corynebacterium propinquum]
MSFGDGENQQQPDRGGARSSGSGPNTMLPTTKAQVSGHKFLRRRVEHGVVTGDIRMIHDPLATRRRALIFGTVATVLIGAGAGVLAWLSPEPDPGDAVIVRSEHGQLYTLLDGRYHPTTNLASARLLAGSPEDPVAIGADNLAQRPHGIPVGIVDAPNNLPTADDLADAADSGDTGASAPSPWAGCIDFATGTLSVVADNPEEAFLLDAVDDDAAALVEHDGTQWLVSADGRVEIPDGADEFSRAVRRGLGLSQDSAVWQAPPELLANWTAKPAFSVPPTEELPEVLEVKAPASDGHQWWALLGAGDTPQEARGIMPLSQLEAQILQDMGAQSRRAESAEVHRYPDAQPAAVNWNVPEFSPDLLDDAHGQVCAGGEGKLVVLNRDAESAPDAEASDPVQVSTVEISGAAAADYFVSTRTFSHGVASEHGYHVLTPSGRVHDVDGAEAMQAVGAPVVQDELLVEEVSWDLLRLLPEGPGLDERSAWQARE